MKRRNFIKTISVLPLSHFGMISLSELGQLADKFENTLPMPVFFFGHGSPMNAIEDNEFTLGWKNAIKRVPKPQAVLCISAHWETRGVQITAMDKPATIHDFGGFPQALFDVQYPAPGSKEMALLTQSVLTSTEVVLDQSWGLDHGCWSVLKKIYPAADVPVMQMSLNVNQNPEWHYQLGKELMALRKKGILIVGSGNIVHNLGRLNWQQPNVAFDWATEANTGLKQMILDQKFERLAMYKSMGSAYQMAIPTAEHYLPLLYVMSLKGKDESIQVFNDKIVMGSIAMTSFKIS
ncbi:MAG: 4,5-DOPA dioxygenase extradiol [Saprospiraceae bacterium]